MDISRVFYWTLFYLQKLKIIAKEQLSWQKSTCSKASWNIHLLSIPDTIFLEFYYEELNNMHKCTQSVIYVRLGGQNLKHS